MRLTTGHLLIDVCASVLLALSLLACSTPGPQLNQEMRMIGPADVPAESETISQGTVALDSASHPLSSVSATGPLPYDEAVYAYDAVEEFVSFTPQATSVMHYRYSYSDATAAHQAADNLAEGIAEQAVTVVPLNDVSALERFDASSRDLFLVSGQEEGNILLWFVGTDDRYLHLVVVDGFDREAVRATFDSVVTSWLAGTGS